ncbi:signal recognition particle-docking protein FtsY [Ignatzschineria ureiclastica]|uniref:Signal recognition particle receptor FtsY n=1 Tax=Ignatzschineria ureiclastica TaxID=472582 RepID=A0A2U2AG07_9GAMM|nr:signal recognition particle-docking protein FtsY [Ignatzschineria ureiclastica]PWD81585.1 signal recognition particle-docking protein FtsY [Ignatzschineria ureiclastica]GHA01832.1 hypothetical protein GCM10007162_17800 [Ignatzschineria ureiclastica]
MAEKKPGFFSRLFGGKKQKEVEKEIAPVTQSSDEPIIEEATERAPEKQDQKNVLETETVDPETSTTVEVIDTVAEGIITEAKENLEPHRHTEEDTTSDSDDAPIKAQHGFIEEIAEAAKAEIKAHDVHEAVESQADVVNAPEKIEIDNRIEVADPEVIVNDTALNDDIAETITNKEVQKTSETSIPVDLDLQDNDNAELDTQKVTDEAEEVEALVEPAVIEVETTEVETSPIPESHQTAERPAKKPGFFARLSQKLSKTRNSLTEGLADLFLGKKEINEEILEELETRLLMADVGINVTTQLLDQIRDSVSRKSLSNVDELFAALKVQMKEILAPVSKPLVIDTSHKPYVLLMIGVNGVGKTTTIGKLAKKFQNEGKSVMLAAGDTFRAAAVEQLEIWGERNHIPVVSQKEGADPASVIFDAMESAKAKKVDILIADTAGRLHTDSGLMQELAKINRVIKRHDESAPHEVMLVVDASTGQNALNQARQFNATIPLSGITFTKLDGTAKGGIIFAIAEELKIPIRFIGVGETIDDLRPFNAEEFVDALIGEPDA